MQVPCKLLAYPSPRYKSQAADARYDQRTRRQVPARIAEDMPVNIPSEGGSRWKVPVSSTFFSTRPKIFTFGFMRVRQDPPSEHGRNGPIWNVPQHPFAVPDEAVDKHVQEFEAQLNRCGISHLQKRRQPTIDLAGLDKNDLNAALQEAKSKGYDLVVLVLSKPNVGIYSAFKTLAERSVGLQTVCLVEKGMYGPRHTEYIMNVMMKVNLKLGGFTHSVESVRSYLEQDDVMVLGGKTLPYDRFGFQVHY
jgi:hypothetical protein